MFVVALSLLMSSQGPAVSSRELVGMIEGTQGVFVRLERNDDRLSGTLRYRQPDVRLGLVGVVDQGVFVLDEIDPNTKAITGKLRLTRPPPIESAPPVALIGTWTRADGSGARAVTLQERADALVTARAVVVAEARVRTIKPSWGEPYRALPKVPVVLLRSPAATRAARHAVQRRLFSEDVAGVASDPFAGVPDALEFGAHVLDCVVVVQTSMCSYRSCSSTHAIIDIESGADRSGAAFFPAGSTPALRRLLLTKRDAVLQQAIDTATRRERSCLPMLRELPAAPPAIDIDHLDVEPTADGIVVHLDPDLRGCAPPADLSFTWTELMTAFPTLVTPLCSRTTP